MASATSWSIRMSPPGTARRWSRRRLLVAEGRVEREVEHAEVPIIHLIVRRLIDRSDLLDSLVVTGEGTTGSDWADRTLGHADEVRRPEPGSRRPPKAKLPGSRDFR